MPFHTIYVQALLSALLLGILQVILTSNSDLQTVKNGNLDFITTHVTHLRSFLGASATVAERFEFSIDDDLLDYSFNLTVHFCQAFVSGKKII